MLPTLLLLGLACLAPPAQDPAQAASAPTEPLAYSPKVLAQLEATCTTALDELVERAGLPGASLAIVLPGGQTLAIASGTTDPEGGRPLTPADRMLSGSVGKSYVAAMALHLAARGKLDLDSELSAHLGELPWFERLAGSKAITIRHLLRHQSGLERYVFAPEFWQVLTSETDKVWEPSELIAFVLDREPLFPPGEGWAYADTNYILVGMVLEQVADATVYDYVHGHLLAPHGLADTVPSDSRRIPGLVQGHTTSFRTFGLPDRVLDEAGSFVINPQFEWCGGGFASTPLDLARWARIYYSGEAFDLPYLDQLLKTVDADPRLLGPGSAYGPGCIVRPSRLGQMRGHDGIMTGYEASTAWFPELEVAAALQLNMDGNRELGKPLPLVLVDLVALAAGELGLELPEQPSPEPGPAPADR